VLGFGLASLLSDMGHEAGTAALPSLLTALGAAPLALGLIEGIADGVVCFAKLYGGALANRLSLRKPLAVGGYAVTGLSIGLFALATSWLHILLARCVGWLARGIRSPARSAMLADAVPRQALGRAIGFHRAMDTLGAIAGPALATLLLPILPLRQVFVCAMVPGVLAAVAFMVLVRPQHASLREPPPPLVRGLVALPSSFRRFLVAVLLFGAGDFARTLLILRATQLLTPARGAVTATAIGMSLFVLHNLVAAACAYPIGRLADSVSPRRLLAVGYALGAVTALGAALATPSLPGLAALFIVAGLVIGIEETIESVLCARLAPQHLRGTAYGALAATNGVGDLVSSSLVGLLWTALGPATGFGLAAVACALGTLLLVAVREDADHAPEPAARAL
jgi:MFS family permease